MFCWTCGSYSHSTDQCPTCPRNKGKFHTNRGEKTVNTKERIAKVLKRHTKVVNNTENRDTIEVVSYTDLLDDLIKQFTEMHINMNPHEYTYGMHEYK